MNNMNERFESSPHEFKMMDSSQIAKNFLIDSLFADDHLKLEYSHYDRMIIGGVKPDANIELGNYNQLKSEYFLERREIGIINVGTQGEVQVDGSSYRLDKLDCLYVGRGARSVRFSTPGAKFFLLSSPAHKEYPTVLMKKSEATPAALGSPATSNERTIFKYIHLDGIRSCQLVMGLTILKEGSVWNTMPPHTHNRRMEVYLYFDLATEQRVFHFMGQPEETRHILIKNESAVISPPWSIHAGCGTSNYSFIWGMAGENQSFSDMDFVDLATLR